MKAVYFNQPGGPEVLTYGDLPEPEPGPGEVMLRVHASALNRADLGLLRRGRNSYPHIPGMDIAGEIAALSPEAAAAGQWQVGDRVLLENRVKCELCDNCIAGIDQYCRNQKRLGVDLDGGHADYVVAPAVNVYKIPDPMTFAEAAALPLAGHTAWQCMVVQGQVQPWDDVLIHAAGSGVGSMAIQIARMVGARVITTAGSDWKLEKAKEWGAWAGINYRETDSLSQRVMELTDGQGVDLVFDVVGADVWDESMRCLKPGGRLVITGVTSGARTMMDLSILQGRPLHLMGSGGRTRRSFGDLMKMVNQGELRGIVGQTFPLPEVASAHRVMASRDFYGKLVIEN